MPGEEAPTPKERDRTDSSSPFGSVGRRFTQFQELSSTAITQAKPFLQKLEPFIAAAYPYCVLVKEHGTRLFYVLRPYYDDEVGSIGLALVLLFLGGHFAMTIACWQVFRVSGKRLFTKSWNELNVSFQEAVRALQKDPEARATFDLSGDGTISPSELFVGFKDIAVAKTDEEHALARHKVFLLMKCIDPTKIWEATLGIWTGIVAVLATLRSRFVQSVTIGANVGKKVMEIMMPLVQGKLHEAFPQHQKWVDFLLKMCGGVVGAIIALFLIKLISAFNSALEGANLLVATGLRIGARKGYPVPTLEQSRAAIWVVAMVGFFSQLRSGFNLPLILRIALSPVLSFEYMLSLISTRPLPV